MLCDTFLSTSSLFWFCNKTVQNFTFRLLIDRNLKMETIIANIEVDENLDEETKKQQVSPSNTKQYDFLNH